jgi:hypothetical protein
MASCQFTAVQDRLTAFLAMPSWTLDELQRLVPPGEAALHAHMAAGRLDGTPRPARQCSVYQHGPLPTPEARRFFLLTYLKPYSLQGVQGRRCGRGQSTAKQWRHVRLPVVLAALRPRGDAPARSLTARAPG